MSFLNQSEFACSFFYLTSCTCGLNDIFSDANIYEIQEIRTLSVQRSMLPAWTKSAGWAISQPELLLPIQRASLGQTHHFPVQSEWRWISAIAWLLKQLELLKSICIWQKSGFHVIFCKRFTLSWPPDGKGFLSWNVAGLLSCSGKVSHNTPSLPQVGRSKTVISHFLKDPEG